MNTLRTPGMPREEDLPALPASAISSLVDALIAQDATPVLHDVTLVQQAPATPRRPHRPARTWLAAAAAVLVVGAVTMAVSGTDESVTPPAATGGPGPGHFPCGGEMTSATVTMPGIHYGAGPMYTSEMGIAGDTLCFRKYPESAGSAAPAVVRSPDPAAPVPFFAVGENESHSVYESGATEPSQSFYVAYAYGAVTPQVDRVQFVPTDQTGSTADFGSFYPVADVKAFEIPFQGAGTLNFYAGAELVDSKPVDASPTTPTDAGDPGTAAPFIFVTADGISDYSYPLGQRPHIEGIGGPSVSDPTQTIDHDDYPEAAIVLTSWASWCGPCRSQAPELSSTSAKYQDQGVQFIGLDIQDTRPLAADFITEREISFPSIFDPSASVLEKAIPGFPTSAVPATVILDRNHNLAKIYLRAVTAAELGGALDELAAE